MYLKRYTISALLFIFVLGAFVNFNINSGSYSLSFFGINLPELPIYILVVIPVVLFYFASLFHMMFYAMIGSFKLRKYQKDYEKILNAIHDAFLNKENRQNEYKTTRYQTLGKIVDHSNIMPSLELHSVGNQKIDTLLKIIEDVKSGKTSDLKKYNLDKSNQLLIANIQNGLSNNEIQVSDIINNQDKYDDSIVKKAFATFIESAPFSQIKKYSNLLDKKSIMTLLTRIKSDENSLELSNEEIISLLISLDYTENEFIAISKELVTRITPDDRIKIFEILSEKNEIAMSAYMYTLLDLEMLNIAEDILDNSQPDEFLEFKAYRDLKILNKSYDLDLFIR